MGSSLSSICGMAPKLHMRAMMLQVPYTIKTASARQPTSANGRLVALSITRVHPCRNQFIPNSDKLLRPWFNISSLHTSTYPYGCSFRSFQCNAAVMAPNGTEAHVLMPNETEDHTIKPNGTRNSRYKEGSTANQEISSSFAAALNAFEALHGKLQASRLDNAVGQADLDVLEASIGGMEAVMSNTALTECWHVGSACLKLAWLYSDASDVIKEPLTQVLSWGHRALNFLESLQVPVWTYVSCSYVLGNAYFKSEKFEDAIHHLEKASSMIKDLEPKGPPNTEQAQLVDAVRALAQNSRIRLSQHLSNQAREYVGKKEDHPMFISTMKKAIEAVSMCTDLQPVSVAAQLEGSLGFFYLQTDQADEALPLLKNALAKIKSVHGPQSPESAIMLNHLGVAYTEVCKLGESIKHFEAAKAILSRHTRVKGDGTEITLYNNIAQVYFLHGRVDDAIASQRKLIELIKQNMEDKIETPFTLEGAEEKLEEMIQQSKAGRRRS